MNDLSQFDKAHCKQHDNSDFEHIPSLDQITGLFVIDSVFGRCKLEPDGEQGYLRVDTVHQGDIQKRCREPLIQMCDAEDISILKGVVSADHVHMHIEYPPKIGISDIL